MTCTLKRVHIVLSTNQDQVVVNWPNKMQIGCELPYSISLWCGGAYEVLEEDEGDEEEEHEEDLELGEADEAEHLVHGLCQKPWILPPPAHADSPLLPHRPRSIDCPRVPLPPPNPRRQHNKGTDASLIRERRSYRITGRPDGDGEECPTGWFLVGFALPPAAWREKRGRWGKGRRKNGFGIGASANGRYLALVRWILIERPAEIPIATGAA